jgi:hypothetical protein
MFSKYTQDFDFGSLDSIKKTSVGGGEALTAAVPGLAQCRFKAISSKDV